jgi:hypothetical protein
MTGQVLHHPRLAWDAARVFVRAAEAGDAFGWLGERLAELLGDDYRQALVESWNRLWWSERPDVREAEAGMWRARLEDVLGARPDLGPALRELTDHMNLRLAGLPPR